MISARCRPVKPLAGISKRAVPAAGSDGMKPVYLLSYSSIQPSSKSRHARALTPISISLAARRLAPADALHLDRDRGAGWAAIAHELGGDVDAEAGLCQQTAALLHHDVVHEAEIFRRHEMRGDVAGFVACHGGDPVGDRRELAAVIFRDRHVPLALDGAPDQVEFLLGGKTLAADGNGRADRAVLGRGAEPSDKTTHRLR